MAYGQTGTGKTYTLGRLGEEDTAARGIMVRSMEDILANISPEMDSVSVSYLQVVEPLTSSLLIFFFVLLCCIWISCMQSLLAYLVETLIQSTLRIVE